MKILVTGATGLIGKQITHALMVEGHQVIALSRSPKKLSELPENQIFSWSDDKPVPLEALKNCDVIIHLAGEGIADKRWTNHRKKRIWDSRVVGTNNLIESLKKLEPKNRPSLLISGSAIGYYGDSNAAQDETANHGEGFLSQLCIEWEAAALKSWVTNCIAANRFGFSRTGWSFRKDGSSHIGYRSAMDELDPHR